MNAYNILYVNTKNYCKTSAVVLENAKKNMIHIRWFLLTQNY